MKRFLIRKTKFVGQNEEFSINKYNNELIDAFVEYLCGTSVVNLNTDFPDVLAPLWRE